MPTEELEFNEELINEDESQDNLTKFKKASPVVPKKPNGYRGSQNEISGGTDQYSSGKPSKLAKEKLMATEGMIPLQSGTNRHHSQKGMTGFGTPRDVLDHTTCTNLKPVDDEEKLANLKAVLPLQSGTNKHASQSGMTGFGRPRDVINHVKTKGSVPELSDEKSKATEGVIRLQSGTNKLASQAGMTGFGMPRSVLGRYHAEQDTLSQGFINLQMGTNKFASQSGMTGFGMPRTNISKYRDSQRGEIRHDESTMSRQVSGYRDGASQAGMTGIGMPRNTTVATLKTQERKSQGIVPYQMGINWADSQAGKTGFGQPRQIVTSWVDDVRGDLPEELSRAPHVPFWSGAEKFANQTGMTAMGMPRDCKGNYLRRLW